MIRYPIAPLAEACGLTEHALCVRLGLKGSTLQETIRDGISELRADRYAVKMGLHPFVVWPEMTEVAVATEETAQEAQVERRRAQWSASARKRWANDADHRAARAEYMRQYRAESKKALAAQSKRWADENRERRRAITREAMRRQRARRKTEQEAAA